MSEPEPQALHAKLSWHGPLKFIYAHLGEECQVDVGTLRNRSSVPAGSQVLELLRNPLLRAQVVRVVTDGKTRDVQAFSKTVSYNGREVRDSLDSVALRRAFANGSTLVIEDVGKWHERVARMCNEIFNDRWLYANAAYFMTKSGNAGFPFHADEETTFIFQVAGRKKWHVADYVAGRLGSARVPSSERVFEFVLEPGDMACIPPRHPHRTAAVGDSDSIHLTIGVRRFKLKDFLRDLAARGRMAHIPALDEEIGSIERSIDPLMRALDGAAGDIWRREMAVASIRVASGMADRGFDFSWTDDDGSRGSGEHALGDLMWRVSLGDRALVCVSGTFAMMDEVSAEFLRSAVAARAASPCGWRSFAEEVCLPSGVREFLRAAGWVLGDDESEAGRRR
jgi:mannose-6-phosphate isomerase-like protein (cupin superfamily)